MPFTYEYPRPAVTVDAVVIARCGGAAKVLLIRRGAPPFEGMWALPGGFIDMDEDLPDAARRELAEETGLRLAALEQIGAYGAPGRDPRGRTIGVGFLAVIDDVRDVQGGDDAADARWFRLDDLPALAFDHAQIIADGRARLAADR